MVSGRYRQEHMLAVPLTREYIGGRQKVAGNPAKEESQHGWQIIHILAQSDWLLVSIVVPVWHSF